MLNPSHLLTVTFPSADHPMNDLLTHTLYVAKREVDLLPLRRVLTSSGKLRESVILLNELSPANHSLVLRVKYVAVDFTRDFDGNDGIVPGTRFVGRIPLRHEIVDGTTWFRPQDKFLVFPYSACWLQNNMVGCNNCKATRGADLGAYKTHRRTPCTCGLVYGKLLHGGLQDYIRVLSPAHSLVKIPELVSVHDCCFLFDISLPFLSFCIDVLAPLLKDAPIGRVLVFLDDMRTQSNDCLLVIQHLQLDQLVFTLTDLRTLMENPELVSKYRDKFPHVLVFAAAEGAQEKAVQFGMGTGLTPETSRLTLALFRHQQLICTCPDDRKLYKPVLSYKDKFLLEALLETLDMLNQNGTGVDTELHPEDPIQRMQTVESSGTPSLNDTSYIDQSVVKAVSETGASKRASVQLLSPRSKPHVSWLHCDRDFRLCLDDSCVHTLQSKCHHTRDLNEMIGANSKLRRAFYTHRLACHVKLNAFIF